jgi:hypothetical protein
MTNPGHTQKHTKPIKYKATTEIINTLKNSLNELIHTKTHSNITRKERNALKQLKNNPHIIIKPCDKNLGTAIIERNTYIQLAEEHLNDNTTYKPLTNNPLHATNTKIHSALTHLHKAKLINKKLYKKLKPNPKKTKPGTFYALPKLHKPTLTIRPIISNIAHPTENLSKHLHKIIHNTAIKAQTYIKNSYTLVEQLKNIHTTQHTYIITADIESLYTNIPHTDGEKIVTQQVYQDKLNTLKPKSLIAFKTLLHNTLTNNIFTFNNKHYSQIKGTAMGTSMAPAYANTYLKQKEDLLLKHTTHKQHIILYKRYIDDILIIYDNQDDSLTDFIQTLKHAYNPLTLNLKTGKQDNFLDIQLKINHTTHTIDTSIHHKPLNTKEIIHYNSLHPTHIKQNILTNELLRIERICSNYTQKRQEQAILLYKALKNGYTKKHYKQALKKTHNIAKKPSQKDLLNYAIMTYNHATHTLAHKLKENINEKEKETKELTQKIPFTISFKTMPSIKDILVRSKLPSNPDPDTNTNTSIHTQVPANPDPDTSIHTNTNQPRHKRKRTRTSTAQP